MYTNNNNTMFPGEYFGNFQPNGVSELSNFPSSSSAAALVVPPPPPPLLVTDKFGYNEFESLVNYNSSVSSDSYGSTTCSSASYGTRTPPSFIQRSVSSHSLPKNGLCGPTMEYLDSDPCHVRRVYSTGDLNRINNGMQQSHQRSESPLSNESSSSIIEGMMSKACRYSPEEKKERIEKYRSKRTQRNFNKKIKYACRKTLADSRPRIRGRFARNEDFEKIPDDQVEWGPLGGEEDDEDDDNWVHFLDALSANLIP